MRLKLGYSFALLVVSFVLNIFIGAGVFHVSRSAMGADMVEKRNAIYASANKDVETAPSDEKALSASNMSKVDPRAQL